MDIRSVCQWRATCRTNYQYATSSLRRSLTSRLGAFVPQPLALIDAVTKYGAVFGGELALSFILRLEPYTPLFLEIFASNYQYERLCETIVDNPSITALIDSHVILNSSLFRALRRLVAQTLAIRLTNGKTIYVHQSYTCSPSAPIARATCTAFSNFVTEYSFGCSHPELTFARRALLSDEEIPHFTPQDSQSLDRLLAHEFSLAISPTAWPEYRRNMDGDTLVSAEECWRHRFLCPKQGRFFGDRGSLVGFFDPLAHYEARCVKDNLPPFGPMVIWRLMTSFDCDDGCEYLDDVLEQGVVSIPVLFKKDPFGELRDCVSDRTLRTSPYYRSFGRPRCLSI
ncbi:hypothetical protein GSI_11988 [Ganoderma sinense ZZ0214-1]|uniref:Uncharacterized protein n=1 Tax=Ganoderma sinense ZZ0214-1 TaxID=1077348 RepID=A0A2G8RXI9_9APHY|nr:hypothetical protein GSI_11988 [Ganoderma sinense ZZ0214-1]